MLTIKLKKKKSIEQIQKENKHHLGFYGLNT